MSFNVAECNAEHDTRCSIYTGGLRFKFYRLGKHNYAHHLGAFGGDRQARCLFLLRAILTLCHSYLNPYCLGRKTAFFSVGI
jgi:hypothetical protein